MNFAVFFLFIKGHLQPQTPHAARQGHGRSHCKISASHGATRPSQGMVFEQYLYRHCLFEGSEPWSSPRTQSLPQKSCSVVKAAPYTGLLPPSMSKNSILPTVSLGKQSQQGGDLLHQDQVQPQCGRGRTNCVHVPGPQPCMQGERKRQSCTLLTHTRSSPSKVLTALCPWAAECLGDVAPKDDTINLSPSAQSPD